TDPLERAVERFDRLHRQRFFGRALERHGKMIAVGLPHAQLQIELAPEAIERRPDRDVAGRVFDEHFEYADRSEQVAVEPKGLRAWDLGRWISGLREARSRREHHGHEQG